MRTGEDEDEDDAQDGDGSRSALDSTDGEQEGQDRRKAPRRKKKASTSSQRVHGTGVARDKVKRIHWSTAGPAADAQRYMVVQFPAWLSCADVAEQKTMLDNITKHVVTHYKVPGYNDAELSKVMCMNFVVNERS